MPGLTHFAPVFGIMSLIIVWFIYAYVRKEPNGNIVMQELEDMIHEGAMSFLLKVYSILALFIMLLFILLWLIMPFWQTSIAFLSGSICSIVACHSGMATVNRGNIRTAAAVDKSGLIKGLKILYFTASVTGLTVTGLGVLGVGIWFFIYGSNNGMISCINGFALGASIIALFIRAGGGIYAKAVNRGADLAGKVEAGIPESDPRNPGVIAGNVGDIVVGIVGMGADIFESFVCSVIAAIVIGATLDISSELFSGFHILPSISIEEAQKIIRIKLMAMPLLIIMAGLLSSFAGVFFIKYFRFKNFLTALRYTIVIASALLMILSLCIVIGLGMPFGTFWAIISGLICGIATGLSTEYYTSGATIRDIAGQSKTGSATVILAGLASGMRSTCIPILCICVAVFTGYRVADIYGIALSTIGLVSILGVTMTLDSCGTIAYNTGCISQMAGLGTEIRRITDSLDDLETTATAIGKGFAICSAALTSIALFFVFTLLIQEANPKLPGLVMDIKNPLVNIGIFIGAMVPVIWASLMITSVSRAAFPIFKEVRRQFSDIPGLLEGKIGVKGDHKACISIATVSALKELPLPGLIALITPIAVGLLLGPVALMGTLFGAIVMGVFLAFFMTNTGVTWNNAKKYVEIGNIGGKGSDNHKALLVGYAVGAPLKDSSGASMTTLIKLMSVVAIILAPLLPVAGLFQ